MGSVRDAFLLSGRMRDSEQAELFCEEAEAEAAKEAERLQKEAEEEITNTDDNIAEA